MKNLIRAMAIGLLVFGLANCGSKGGGGETPAAEQKNGDGIAEGATAIDFTGDGPVISWTNDIDNIYRPHSNPLCINGLVEDDSDDEFLQEKLDELEALLKRSVISKGSQDRTSSDSRLLTIKYNDGSTRTFNLDKELASKDEDTLSNGKKIAQFFEDIRSQLTKVSCPGKGDRND